jgi:N12 class adenine-specific DNA methylase
LAYDIPEGFELADAPSVAPARTPVTPAARSYEIPAGFELVDDAPPATSRFAETAPLPPVRPGSLDLPADPPMPMPRPKNLPAGYELVPDAPPVAPGPGVLGDLLKTAQDAVSGAPATPSPGPTTIPAGVEAPRYGGPDLNALTEELNKNISALDVAGAEKTVKAHNDAITAANAQAAAAQRDFDAATAKIDKRTPEGSAAYNAQVNAINAKMGQIKSGLAEQTKGLDIAGAQKTFDAVNAHVAGYKKKLDDRTPLAPVGDAPQRYDSPLEHISRSMNEGFDGENIGVSAEDLAKHPVASSWLRAPMGVLGTIMHAGNAAIRGATATGAEVAQGAGVSRETADALEREANAMVDWQMTGQSHIGGVPHVLPKLEPRYTNPDEFLRRAESAKPQDPNAPPPESYTDSAGNVRTPTDPAIQEGLRNAEAARAQQEAERAAARPAEDAAQAQAAAEAKAKAGAAPADDTGQNVPESPETLKAQQDQLKTGARKAQMFPQGTEEPPLPEGMSRVETPRGVFHFNPDKVTAAEIKTASAAGRENDVLDLGPHSKADVNAAAAGGDPHINVTERQPDGTEVKTSAATEGTAADQAATMEATKTPGNTVGTEPVHQVIIDRENDILRQMGWPDEDIAKFGAAERAEQIREAMDSGITASEKPAPTPGSREAPVKATTPEHVTAAASNAATPTPAQADAGNYRKGHVVTEDGLPVTIETPKGAQRTGIGPDGKPWSTTMPAHYGYVKGTVGADGDHVDVYLGDKPSNGKAFVVDQVHPDTGKFDEHKIILHAETMQEAVDLYRRGFSDGRGHDRVGAITETTTTNLKDWLANGKTAEPFGKLPEPAPERENLFAKDTDPTFLKNMSSADRAAFEKGSADRKNVATKIGHAIDNLVAKDPNHPRVANLKEKLQGVLDTIMPGRDTSRPRVAPSPARGNTYSATREREQRNSRARAQETDAYADKMADYLHRNDMGHSQGEGWAQSRGHSPEFVRKILKKLDALHRESEAKEAAVHEQQRRKVEELAVARRAEAAAKDAADKAAAAKHAEELHAKLAAEAAERERQALEDVLSDPIVRHEIEKDGPIDTRKPNDQQDTSTRPAPGSHQAADEPRGDNQEAGSESPVSGGREAARGSAAGTQDAGAGERGQGAPEAGKSPGVEATPKGVEEPGEPRHPINELGAGLMTVKSGGMLRDPKMIAFLKAKGLASGALKAWRDGQGLKLTPLGQQVCTGWKGYGQVPGPEIADMADKWQAFRDGEGGQPVDGAKPKGWREIGTNARGNKVWEDHNGVRSYTEKGVRVSEPVQIIPGKGYSVVAEKGPDFTPVEKAPVDTVAPKDMNAPSTGTGDDNANQGAGLREDAPAVPPKQQSADAIQPPEVGGASGLLGADRPVGGADVRHTGSPDDDGKGPAEGLSGKGAGTRGDPADGGRDSAVGDREPAATPADAGRVEAEKALADRARRNYVIDPNEGIGDGGAKTKVRANLEAIRIVKEVMADQRQATVEEKQALARYVGWGAYAQKLFDPGYGRNADEWKAERLALRSMLTPKEYEAARASTLNAHYTSVPVIQGMWEAAQGLGFRGGRALEPASGVGSFIGLTPEAVRGRTSWTASELDPITGNIAKALYGGADVNVAGFETLIRPDNYFDLAISNVPFGSYGIRDKRYGSPNLLIHDYFFVKSLDKVRPGGMVAFITSAGTMNKVGDRARNMISDRADLVGAIRLPGGRKGAFAGNAGTEVTTDIIFLRKRAPGEAPSTINPWSNIVEVKTKDGPAQINEYFAKNPKMVIGTHALTGSMYGANEYTVEPPEGTPDYGKLIAKAASQFPQELAMTARTAAPRTAKAPPASVDASDIGDGVKEGGFFLKGKDLFKKDGGVGRPAEVKGADVAKVKALVGMRDLVNKLLASQATGKIEGNDVARKELNKQYAAFVKAHGPINLETSTVTARLNRSGEPVVINKMPNFNAFRLDPDAYKVAALEDYDTETQTARPAAILQRDVVGAPATRKIEGASDAVAASLEAFGELNEHHIANLLGIKPEQVEGKLADVAFRDPNGDKLVPNDEYLSGDVVQKLEEARAAAVENPGLKRNIEALEKVQPEPLRHDEIIAQFGAPWVPEDILKDFLQDELGANQLKLKRNALTAEWMVDSRGFAPDARARFSTPRVGLDEVVKAALNMRRLTVWDKDGESTTVNVEETRQANIKLDELRDFFTGNEDTGVDGWVWKDPTRRERLAAIYNRQFNATVLRKFDGSHLTFPGMASAITGSDGKPVPFSLRAHQKNAVWRALQRGNTLFDHVVGAGKTFTMIATGMEGRRLGIMRKPAYVVPNHMLEQFSREFLQAYPGAKLLVAQREEMTRDARRGFAAKTATGDWDGVVITHDAFGRLNMSAEWQAQHVRKQVQQLEDTIREMQAEGGDKRTVKQIENAKLKLQARIQDLMNPERKDQGVTFEEMGIDHLFVDEAHLFKNLSFVTKMTRVKGLAQGSSQRAEDLYLKMKWLEQSRPGRSAVFATGTPISNTIAEMYTMQRYLQEPRLAQMGLDRFDSWAGTFGSTQENTALSADGRTMKTETSFSKFVNIPELVSMYAEIADTQTADMLKLPRPELAMNERGERGIIAVKAQPSAEEDALIQSFVVRAQNMKGPVVKGGDNMLKVVTDGRKVATDGRLYDPSLPENPNGKIARAVENIVKHYRAGKEPALAQMVFLDMGTPKPPPSAKKAKVSDEPMLDEDGNEIEDGGDTGTRMNLYEALRQKLMERGIPKHEIAFIHEATDDRKKGQMFEKVRRGEIRVLVGSTGKMGVGTNVQRRLIAMHHIDAPYKPAEVEQRDGRGLRQGNMNPEFFIYRYVTEKSFDAFMWQKLDTKSRFIAQLKSGAKGVRVAEDIDNPLPEAAEMKAAAAGDPRIMEEANLKRQVTKLEAQRRSFKRTQNELGYRSQQLARSIEHTAAQLPAAQEAAARVQDVSGDKFSLDLSGLGYKAPFTDRKAAGEAIKGYFTSAASQHIARAAVDVKMGTYGGMPLSAYVQRSYVDSSYTTNVRPYIRAGKDRTHQSFDNTLVEPESNLDHFTRKLDSLLKNVKDEPGRLDRHIESQKADLARVASQDTKAAWPREADYQATVGKLREIQAALKAKGETPKPVDAEHASAATMRRLTPEAKQALPEIAKQVRSIIQRVAGNHANGTQFFDGATIGHVSAESMMRSSGQADGEAKGSYTDVVRLIKIALDSGEAGDTAYHESFHALEHGGAFRPEEMRLFEREKDALREHVGKVYGKTPEEMARVSDDEVRAYAFEDYAHRRDTGDAGPAQEHVGIRRAFDKLREILRRIRDYLRGKGFRKVEDVFKDAYEGKVGERPATGEGANGSARELARLHGLDERAAGMKRTPQGERRYFADKTISEKIRDSAKMPDPTSFIEKVQNSDIRVQQLQAAVADLRGAPLPQAQRPADAKRLMSGKAWNEQDNFIRDRLNPLSAVMKQNGLTRQDVAEFVYATAVPERNALMDARDPNNNGEGAGINDAEAQRILDVLHRMGKLPALQTEILPRWKQIVREQRERLVRGGLMTQDAADEWALNHPNYAPFSGYEDSAQAPDDFYFRSARKLSTFGDESKPAFGRNGTISADPVVSMTQQVFRSIERVERNKVGMQLWRMFRGLSDADRQALGVRLDEGEFVKTIDPKTGLMTWKEKSPTNDLESVVSVKIAGRAHHMAFEDRLLAQAINRLGPSQLPVVIKQVAKMINFAKSMWTTYVPSFVLRHFVFRYPLEAVLNAGEHGPGAALGALQGLPGRLPMRSIMAVERMTTPQRVAVASRFASGNASEAETWQHYYLEAKAAGARVNFDAIADFDHVANRIDRAVSTFSDSPVDAALAPIKALHHTVRNIEAAMDNAHRLVAYRAARERGDDVAKAALAARDATVDFTVRGTLSPWLNTIYSPFANTAAQTAARMVTAAKRSKTFRYGVLGGVIGSAMLIGLWNYLAGGEDDDGTPFIEKVPEYTRRGNVVIMSPFRGADGKPNHYKIALPYNFAMPFAMGNVFAGMMLKGAGVAHESIGSLVKTLIHASAEALVGAPQEASTLATIAPEPLRPFVHVGTNTNFFGGNVHDPRDVKGRSHASMGMAQTPDHWSALAETANRATGGNAYQRGGMDFYPEDYREIAGYFTNSFERAAVQMKAFKGDVSGSKGINPENVPLASVFMGGSKTYDATDQRHYREARKVAQAAEASYKTALKEDPAAARQMATDSAPQLRAAAVFAATDKEIKAAYKARDQVSRDKTMDESRKAAIIASYDRQLHLYMQQTMRAVRPLVP